MPRRNALGIAPSARKPTRPQPPASGRGEVETLDLRGVTRWVGPMLRIVQVRTFQNYYVSDIGTSPGVLSALTLIRDNPGVRHGVLADAMVVRRPNMTKLVGYLARTGLILRRAVRALTGAASRFSSRPRAGACWSAPTPRTPPTKPA